MDGLYGSAIGSLVVGFIFFKLLLLQIQEEKENPDKGDPTATKVSTIGLIFICLTIFCMSIFYIIQSWFEG
jgi:hypothetical protein